MRKQGKRLAIFCMIIICSYIVVGGYRYYKNIEKRDGYKIGVICWNSDNMLSSALKNYITYLEKFFPVEIEFVTPSMGFLNYEEVAEYLCQQETDAIMNVTTESLPEILKICEQYQVYLFQFWDMPTDTDQIAIYEKSPYFLGYIKNNEKNIAQAMADAIIQAGCEKIVIMETYYCGQSSQVHRVRCDELIHCLEEQKTGIVEKVVRTANHEAAISNLAAQEYKPDGIIFTTHYKGNSLKEVSEFFGNADMKYIYFDLNEHTREDLKNTNLISVSCGQQNIFGLSFAYLYYFLTECKQKRDVLALECDYLLLTSVKEYDDYMKYCIEEIPYDAKTIQIIADSLKEDTKILEQYCNQYSLKNIIRQKQN